MISLHWVGKGWVQVVRAERLPARGRRGQDTTMVDSRLRRPSTFLVNIFSLSTFLECPLILCARSWGQARRKGLGEARQAYLGGSQFYKVPFMRL